VDARVAVVVITRNRVDELAHTLARLQALPERPRTVVVDNGSSDGTSAVVGAQFPDVILRPLSENLACAGRNVGAALVDTPYVAFCDDDMWWAPDALSRAADVLDAAPRCALVMAHVVVEPGGEPDPLVAQLERAGRAGDDAPGIPIAGFLAGATVVRRDVFLRCGGFERRFGVGGEEELLAADLMAAGWSLRFLPDAVVHHAPSRARDVRARRRREVRNRLWATWMRRPLPRVVSRTAGILRSVPRERASALGMVDAVAALPWVVRHRRVVPAAVDDYLSRVEAGA
jgi:GT2 family glycosyltransferase